MSWGARSAKVAIAAAVVGFSVLAGTGAGWAYWTAQATSATTLNAADLTITTANFGSLAKTFTNDSLQHTGSVTVTNTTATASTTRGNVTLTFSATGATAAQRGKFGVVVWLETGTYPCSGATAGPTLASGTWGANFTLSLTGANGLLAGEARTYCARTTITSREDVATSSGSLTVTPAISGQIAVGNFSGSATASTTQSTSNIFLTPTANQPSTTGFYWLRPNLSSAGYPRYCTDVNGGTPGAAVSVISYGCKTSGAANQVWNFTAVAGRAGYFTIATGANTSYVVDGGGSVLMTPAGSGAASQVWQVQLIDAATSRYQIVSDVSGLCWTSPTGTGQNLGDVTLSACGNAAAQQFIMSRVPSGITCTYSTANPYTFTLSFTGSPNTGYRLYDGGTTTLVGAGSTGTSNGTGGVSLTFTRADLGANGTYAIDLFDAFGTQVGTGSVTRVNNTGSGSNVCSLVDMR